MRASQFPAGCPCGRRHEEGSPLVGCPIDLDGYPYRATIDFNKNLGGLWTVTLAGLNRRYRRRLSGPLPVVRVVEFQRRGLGHVHALVLLSDLDVTAEEIRDICSSAKVRDARGTVHRWGTQLDIALLDTGRPEWRSDQKVLGGYLSKLASYAAKDRFPRTVTDERAAAELAVRHEFESRLRAAAARVPGLSARARAEYGLTAQAVRASSSWPADTLVQRRRARAEYARAQARAEGHRDEAVEWRETAMPRFEFKASATSTPSPSSCSSTPGPAAKSLPQPAAVPRRPTGRRAHPAERSLTMALRSIPVDQTRFVATQFVAAEARTDEDGNPRLGRNDRPVYRIAASVILSDGNGAVTAETIDVNVETGPDGVVPGDGLGMLDRVVFDNLTARPWSMDNGR